jgi:hypothetical protein
LISKEQSILGDLDAPTIDDAKELAKERYGWKYHIKRVYPKDHPDRLAVAGHESHGTTYPGADWAVSERGKVPAEG